MSPSDLYFDLFQFIVDCEVLIQSRSSAIFNIIAPLYHVKITPPLHRGHSQWQDVVL